MTKLILPGRTRERIAQEYELEKKVSRGGGDRKSEEADQIRQNGGIDHPKETAEKIAEEHNISPRTVERSADLFRSPTVECTPDKPLSAPSGRCGHRYLSLPVLNRL